MGRVGIEASVGVREVGEVNGEVSKGKRRRGQVWRRINITCRREKLGN